MAYELGGVTPYRAESVVQLLDARRVEPRGNLLGERVDQVESRVIQCRDDGGRQESTTAQAASGRG